MKNNVKLLCTIPAIGFATAVQLIAHLGDGNRFKNAKAAATFTGLTPMIKSSGKSLNTVIGTSKKSGNPTFARLFLSCDELCLWLLQKQRILLVCAAIA